MENKEQIPLKKTPLNIKDFLPKQEDSPPPLYNNGDIIVVSIGKLVINNVSIKAVVEKMKSIAGKTIVQPQTYIIEHPNGWKPNHIRASKYGLDVSKKYLFVKESSITKI